MPFLTISEDGDVREVEELDNDVLGEFDEASMEIYRFNEGHFEQPTVDSKEDEDGEKVYEVKRWSRVTS